MSAEAMGWVFRHSPYTGAALAVHLAVADSVNDQHGHEFWMAQGTLATKARVARQTVNACLDRLVADGYLIDIGSVPSPNPGVRRVRRFLFLFPDVPVVYESRSVVVSRDNSDGSVVVSGDNLLSSQVTKVVVSRDIEPKEPKSEPKPLAASPKKGTPRSRVSAPSSVLARDVVNTYWQETTPKPVLAGGWIALVKIVEKFLVAGHPPEAVARALRTSRTLTTASLLYALNGPESRSGDDDWQRTLEWMQSQQAPAEIPSDDERRTAE